MFIFLTGRVSPRSEPPPFRAGRLHLEEPFAEKIGAGNMLAVAVQVQSMAA